ncbi:hypothetical protein PAPYR_4802 [Paratrimastix pyriformis]|uniref:Uncharacterized protein n=1 Tax=Paratrimastix pyriformis TaxID=342808 RepID=A0ABQ8UJ56_9EUKA|nr:hypothetical protein PAPYR_4802 [Paratrimastix pyriformis]
MMTFEKRRELVELVLLFSIQKGRAHCCAKKSRVSLISPKVVQPNCDRRNRGAHDGPPLRMRLSLNAAEDSSFIESNEVHTIISLMQQHLLHGEYAAAARLMPTLLRTSDKAVEFVYSSGLAVLRASPATAHTLVRFFYSLIADEHQPARKRALVLALVQHLIQLNELRQAYDTLMTYLPLEIFHQFAEFHAYAGMLGVMLVERRRREFPGETQTEDPTNVAAMATVDRAESLLETARQALEQAISLDRRAAAYVQFYVDHFRETQYLRCCDLAAALCESCPDNPAAYAIYVPLVANPPSASAGQQQPHDPTLPQPPVPTYLPLALSSLCERWARADPAADSPLLMLERFAREQAADELVLLELLLLRFDNPEMILAKDCEYDPPLSPRSFARAPRQPYPGSVDQDPATPPEPSASQLHPPQMPAFPLEQWGLLLSALQRLEQRRYEAERDPGMAAVAQRLEGWVGSFQARCSWWEEAHFSLTNTTGGTAPSLSFDPSLYPRMGVRTSAQRAAVTKLLYGEDCPFVEATVRYWRAEGLRGGARVMDGMPGGGAAARLISPEEVLTTLRQYGLVPETLPLDELALPPTERTALLPAIPDITQLPFVITGIVDITNTPPVSTNIPQATTTPSGVSIPHQQANLTPQARRAAAIPCAHASPAAPAALAHPHGGSGGAVGRVPGQPDLTAMTPVTKRPRVAVVQDDDDDDGDDGKVGESQDPQAQQPGSPHTLGILDDDDDDGMAVAGPPTAAPSQILDDDGDDAGMAILDDDDEGDDADAGMTVAVAPAPATSTHPTPEDERDDEGEDDGKMLSGGAQDIPVPAPAPATPKILADDGDGEIPAGGSVPTTPKIMNDDDGEGDGAEGAVTPVPVPVPAAPAVILDDDLDLSVDDEGRRAASDAAAAAASSASSGPAILDDDADEDRAASDAAAPAPAILDDDGDEIDRGDKGRAAPSAPAILDDDADADLDEGEGRRAVGTAAPAPAILDDDDDDDGQTPSAQAPATTPGPMMMLVPVLRRSPPKPSATGGAGDGDDGDAGESDGDGDGDGGDGKGDGGSSLGAPPPPPPPPGENDQAVADSSSSPSHA